MRLHSHKSRGILAKQTLRALPSLRLLSSWFHPSGPTNCPSMTSNTRCWTVLCERISLAKATRLTRGLPRGSSLKSSRRVYLWRPLLARGHANINSLASSRRTWSPPEPRSTFHGQTHTLTHSGRQNMKWPLPLRMKH